MMLSVDDVWVNIYMQKMRLERSRAAGIAWISPRARTYCKWHDCQGIVDGLTKVQEDRCPHVVNVSTEYLPRWGQYRVFHHRRFQSLASHLRRDRKHKGGRRKLLTNFRTFLEKLCGRRNKVHLASSLERCGVDIGIMCRIEPVQLAMITGYLSKLSRILCEKLSKEVRIPRRCTFPIVGLGGGPEKTYPALAERSLSGGKHEERMECVTAAQHNHLGRKGSREYYLRVAINPSTSSLKHLRWHLCSLNEYKKTISSTHKNTLYFSANIEVRLRDLAVRKTVCSLGPFLHHSFKSASRIFLCSAHSRDHLGMHRRHWSWKICKKYSMHLYL